jgi:hypothetical protein
MAKLRFGLSSWITLALLVPVTYMTVSLFRKWHVTDQRLSSEQAAIGALTGRNAVLGKAYDVLQNRKFQICNKSTDPVHVQWISAAFIEGKQLKTFDSARCGAWKTPEIAAGENTNLFLSSSQEGCNWSGNVIYYAIRFTKEKEDESIPFSVADLYRNYDRDCFNIP